MTGTDDAVNSSTQGDGSGDPNKDREFLQDLPPAQVDEDAVHASDGEDDESAEQ